MHMMQLSTLEILRLRHSNTVIPNLGGILPYRGKFGHLKWEFGFEKFTQFVDRF